MSQYKLSRSKDGQMRFDVRAPFRLSLSEMAIAIAVAVYSDVEPVVEEDGDLDRAVAKIVTSQRKAVEIATESIIRKGRENLWLADEGLEHLDTIQSAAQARVESLWMYGE